MRLIKAKNHSFTAQINKNFLHSNYSPEKEAEKFFRKWVSEYDPLANPLIILEPGLGYLLDIIKRELSPKRIIILFYHSDTCRYCEQAGILDGIMYWSPRHSYGLEEFLGAQLGDTIVNHFNVLEWPPALRCFSSESENIRGKFLAYLKILQGNTITAMKFGRKWLYNGLRNFLVRDYSLSMREIKVPIVLVASGFSLNDQIDELKRRADSYFIVALPSSVKALCHAGIIPHLIITTDPGYYAALHYPSFPKDSYVASPISSTPGDLGGKIAGIHQQTWLDDLLDPKGIYFRLKSPEMGTVAATAIRILQNICSQELYILGLDLCIKGIHEHVSPHEFNILSTLSAGRMKPEITNRFKRVHDLSLRYHKGFYYTTSMNTYKSWFQKEKFNKKIFRVQPSPVGLPFQDIAFLPEYSSRIQDDFFYTNPDYPEYRTRKDILSSLLSTWERDLLKMTRDKMIDPSSSLHLLIKNSFPGDRDAENIVSDLENIIKKVRNL